MSWSRLATLAATIRVSGERAAEVGVVLESSRDVRYCADGDARPAADHVALENTAYSHPELVTVGRWTRSGVTGSCPDERDRVCLPLG
ncbi:hypothetical protein [Modestobacter sp. VKM Ac-2984]|uniref:hypothetical protein n=1 Tax=Modestobacter sp. VKM Ac-2984 TaxID=3004138 RepID=UPI0022AA23FF|nr:hypothetical protein [Modestobacter sp. VKM Ac-2984]MCZ2815144.1 hypothetical protein [Modestobacter sp. VKM Ac-2984]